jgi:hypothetical protein
MIWNPGYGKFGMLRFPYHLVMLMLPPWILLVGLVSVAVASLSNPYYLAAFIPPIAAAFHRRVRILISSFVLAQISLL